MVPNQSCVGEGVGIMLWLGLGGSMLSIRKVVSSIWPVTRYPFPIQIVECPGSPPASFRVWPRSRSSVGDTSPALIQRRDRARRVWGRGSILKAVRASGQRADPGCERGHSACRHADELARIPANTRHSTNIVPMLVHRLRRWPNIDTTLDVYNTTVQSQTAVTAYSTSRMSLPFVCVHKYK